MATAETIKALRALIVRQIRMEEWYRKMYAMPDCKLIIIEYE